MPHRAKVVALAALLVPPGPGDPARVAAWRSACAALRQDPRAAQALRAWGPDCAWLGLGRDALQTTPDGCGAAALAAVLRRQGRTVPQRLLGTVCRLPHGGTNLGRLARAARSFGVQPTVGFATAFAALPLPAIVHLRRGHFVVLEGWSPPVAVLFDPGCGRVRIRDAALRDAASGAVLCVGPTHQTAAALAVDR